MDTNLRIRKNIVFLLFCMVGVLIIHSCKKEEAPANPYDAIVRGGGAYADTLNPNSYTWIHRNIFATRCAMPGCHDGNFEPDFRTVQSSYATLVYHPVVKKLAGWNYRVQPYDTAKSWLWKRLNHDLIVSGNDTSQGRMPLYSTPLNTTELQRIRNWILGGAKDVFGQVPSLPNNEPNIAYFAAIDALPPTIFYSADTNRKDSLLYNPFYAPKNTSMSIAVLITDDSTAASALTVNQLKISLKKDDFSAASVYNASYFDFGGTNKFWIATVNTSVFTLNKVYYMRFYTNDGDHTKNTEMPRTEMIDPYKGMWSFIVK